MIKTNLFCISLLALLSMQCTPQKTEEMEQPDLTKDPHSYALVEEAIVTHLDLDIKADFINKTISGTASYKIDNKGATQIILDTRDLDILGVTIGTDRTKTEFHLEPKDEILGQALVVEIKPETDYISIEYKTSPGAEALQWLSPQQTAGKTHPFLFTQGQAILTRTWIPLQDSPGIRFTYSAKVEVPDSLFAVMSATNPKIKNSTGIYEFEMKQPIPGYLMALAIGNLEFKEIGPRTGVYAEPSVLESAAYEFGDMENMLIASEKLYGDYRWEQYDVIVLPPSFPFGGMENPRLTFATPTIIAGDRSLTALIAHEMAHSWSGNLVTNSTWNDMWLNEGFTVYFERRIMEALYGREYSEMLTLLGYQDLQKSLESMGMDAPDTRMSVDLKGRNPDDGLTDVPYEKGYFFLRLLEETVGRETFDEFLKNYFGENGFKSMDSERFVQYLNANLLEPNQVELNVEEWIYQPGLPSNCPVIRSDRFEEVEKAIQEWSQGSIAASELKTDDWSTHEWMHFIRHLPEEMEIRQMEQLDGAFDFTHSGNSEVAAAWYEVAIAQKYSAAYEEVEAFLIRVGRRKFLVPLYLSMKNSDQLVMAKAIYEKARGNYHSVSTNTLDVMLEYKGS